MYNTSSGKQLMFSTSVITGAISLQVLTFEDVKGKWYVTGSDSQYIDITYSAMSQGEPVYNISAYYVDIETMRVSNESMCNTSGNSSIANHAKCYNMTLYNNTLTMTHNGNTLTFVRKTTATDPTIKIDIFSSI